MTGRGASPPPPLAPEALAAELSYVFQSLRRLGVAVRDLDDLTQEVFVTAVQRQQSYDRKRPLRPWLFGIAFRVASAYRNRAHHSREVFDEVEFEDLQPTPEQALEVQQSSALVQRALEELPMERRVLFILHDIDGVSIPEAAASLGVPLNTAYTRLRAARQGFTVAVRRLRAKSPP